MRYLSIEHRSPIEGMADSNCHAKTELNLLDDPLRTLRAIGAVGRQAVPEPLTIRFTFAFASGGRFDRIPRTFIDGMAARLFHCAAAARQYFSTLKLPSNSSRKCGWEFPFVHGRLGSACVHWHAANCVASPRAYRLTKLEFVPQLNPSATDPGLVHGERTKWLLSTNHMNHHGDSRIGPCVETMSLQAQ